MTEQDKIDIANRVLDALRTQAFSVSPPIRQGNIGQVIGATYNKVGDVQTALSRIASQLSVIESQAAPAFMDADTADTADTKESGGDDEVSDRLDFLYTQLRKIADAADVRLDPPPWRETTSP